VSVELTAPWLLRTGVLKEHTIPADIVEGHEKETDPAVNTVEPVGVAVTTTLPDAFGASDSEPGAIVVVNVPERATIVGAMLVGR
jgi:hypothetical protein